MPAAGDAQLAAVPKTQEIALLAVPHVAVARPGDAIAAGVTVAARRPITGEQTALPILSRTTTADGASWLHVMLPGRPNGRTGWILAQGTTLAKTPWRIAISLSGRTVRVYRDGIFRRSFRAVIGKSSTPTPRGRFFVEENVQMLPGAPGGPYALALSARSNVLQEFEGGPGQIAIHGMLNLAGTPGSAASHGCIRLRTADITWLASRITTGVQISVTR
ncbi:MAG: L,D-transpeptidase [Actinobacteria bacterium]|nr:L,D-transpeptidase [Actinomycetota bacterium]